jgi:hypothetical protein
MQNDLDGVGDVKANDLGQHRTRVGEEGVAEGGLSGDALSNQRFDLRASGNGHEVLLLRMMRVSGERYPRLSPSDGRA